MPRSSIRPPSALFTTRSSHPVVFGNGSVGDVRRALIREGVAAVGGSDLFLGRVHASTGLSPEAVAWADKEVHGSVPGAPGVSACDLGDGTAGGLKRAVLRAAAAALGGRDAVYDLVAEAMRRGTIGSQGAAWVVREVGRACGRP